MCPEIVNKRKYDGKSADIWAAGVVFVSMIQGSFPFKSITESELFYKIKQGQFTLDIEDQDMLRLVNKMLEVNPSIRHSANQLLNDKIFLNVLF